MNFFVLFDEKNDEENNLSKISVWFILNNLFKNGLEDDDFDLEIDKSNGIIIIIVLKDLKRFEGKFIFSKNKSNFV